MKKYKENDSFLVEKSTVSYSYVINIDFISVYDASLRGGYMLCFLDDGEGMEPSKYKVSV